MQAGVVPAGVCFFAVGGGLSFYVACLAISFAFVFSAPLPLFPRQCVLLCHCGSRVIAVPVLFCCFAIVFPVWRARCGVSQAAVTSMARHPVEAEVAVTASHPGSPDSHSVLQLRPHSCLPTVVTLAGAAPVASVGYLRRAGSGSGPCPLVCLSSTNTLHVIEVGQADAGVGQGVAVPSTTPAVAPVGEDESAFTAVFGDALTVPASSAAQGKRARTVLGSGAVVAATAPALPITGGMQALTQAWMAALVAASSSGSSSAPALGASGAGAGAGAGASAQAGLVAVAPAVSVPGPAPTPDAEAGEAGAGTAGADLATAPSLAAALGHYTALFA
jgi:hypothetical protein